MRAVLVAGIALGFALAPATAGERSRRDSRQDAAAGGGVVSEARGEAAGHGSAAALGAIRQPRSSQGPERPARKAGAAGARGRTGARQSACPATGRRKFPPMPALAGRAAAGPRPMFPQKARLILSSGASSVGSVARGKAGQSYVNSRTQLKGKSTSDEVKAEAGADAASDRKRPSRAGTSAQVRRSETLVGSKIRSSATGNDSAPRSARGTYGSSATGQTIKTVSKAETCIEQR